jgi:hypothetical protein
MWNDANGWGVQIYPAATNTVAYNNVIDRAGTGFVICDQTAGSKVYHNVITNSTGLPDAGISLGKAIGGCGPAPGSNNNFTDNDSYNNAGGIGSITNVYMTGNFTANPGFVDAGSHNYQISTTSTAGSWNLWNGS